MVFDPAPYAAAIEAAGGPIIALIVVLVLIVLVGLVGGVLINLFTRK